MESRITSNRRLSFPGAAYFLFLLLLFKYFFPKTLEVTRKSRIFAEEKAALGKLKASFLCARLHFLCPKIRMPSVRRPN